MFGVNMAFDDYTQTYKRRLESLGKDDRVVKNVTLQYSSAKCASSYRCWIAKIAC